MHNIFTLPDYVSLNSKKTGSPGLYHSGLDQELLILYFSAYLAAPVYVLYSCPLGGHRTIKSRAGVQQPGILVAQIGCGVSILCDI